MSQSLIKRNRLQLKCDTPRLWPPDRSRARGGTQPWPADLYRQRNRAHLHQSSVRAAHSEQRETRSDLLYTITILAILHINDLLTEEIVS
jgi:hypothetical protein